jgi:hypothetical protein
MKQHILMKMWTYCNLGHSKSEFQIEVDRFVRQSAESRTHPGILHPRSPWTHSAHESQRQVGNEKQWIV